ncbi:MAG: hypothetical protein WA108_13680 [Thiobacillus sp.]
MATRRENLPIPFFIQAHRARGDHQGGQMNAIMTFVGALLAGMVGLASPPARPAATPYFDFTPKNLPPGQ